MVADYLERLKSPLMGYYKCLYSQSKQWTGQPLEGKRLIVYCEQGCGDIIQFVRHLPALREHGCHITLHCPKSLHRLFGNLADEFVDREHPFLPEHDYHVLSMSLPFILDDMKTDHTGAYIHVDESEDLSSFEGLKIGIAWEGNPHHSNNSTRCCPLEYFTDLARVKGFKIFALQKQVHNKELVVNCDDMTLYSVPIDDYYDTAKLINSLDLVVSVDTSVAHLAGAMNKKVYCLLSSHHDYRWQVGKWYASINLIKQKQPGDWDSVFEQLFKELDIKTPRLVKRGIQDVKSVLWTGGIGDFIALEGYFSDKKTVKSMYYTTRAANPITELFEALDEEYPVLRENVVLWDDFTEIDAFINKTEVAQQLPDGLPPDWPEVADWSIDVKFQEIDAGYYKFQGSSLLKKKLADISRFKLPERYVVIVPYSKTHKPGTGLTGKEWLAIHQYLKKHDMRGVIVNTGEQMITQSKRMLDLSGQTTICEAIEILKGAAGYMGVDSCLSVLAAQLFDEHFFVKSSHEHLLNWKHIYYPTKEKFQFLRDSLVDI